MMCPVALLADAMTWLVRAGILLMIRLTSAVAIAATAFSVAVLLAENLDGIRGTAAETTILSEVIDRPVLLEATRDGARATGPVRSTRSNSVLLEHQAGQPTQDL
jgi:hypothetical protein